MRLAKFITAYRLHHGISLRVLAKEIGITHDSLFRLEHGKKIVNTEFTKVIVFLLDEPLTNNEKKGL